MRLLVAEGAKRQLGSPTTTRTRLVRRHWLIAASAGAIAAATPGYMGFYGGRARAQTLPAGCTDAVTAGTPNDNDGVAEDGETVTCVVTPITDPLTPINGPISTNVSDVTIVVGDDTTPTSVINSASPVPGDAISMNALVGAQTLTIVNAGSSISGTGNGVTIRTGTGAATGDITIVSYGKIYGGVFGYGIDVLNSGVGRTDITLYNDVIGNTGIFARTGDSGADLTVTSDGNVQATGYNQVGIWGQVGAKDGGASSDLTINTSGGAAKGSSVTGGATGIFARNYGSGDTSVTVDDVTGRNAVQTIAYDGDTEVTLTSTAFVNGESGTGVWSRSTSGDILLAGPSGAISSGDVYGAGDGVYLRSISGTITVRDLDSIVGEGLDGVNVKTGGVGGVTISGVDTITGGSRGIYAKTVGGAISIQGSGLVGGIKSENDAGLGLGIGIDADASAAGRGVGGAGGGNINIGGATANGNVTGAGGDGVRALTDGLGTITIAVGAVTTTGNDAAGVRAVTGNASTVGYGDVSITTSGAVLTSGSGSYGIFAETAGDGDIAVNVDDVKATNSGAIRTRAATGTTAITLTSTADVDSGVGAGVDAQSTGGNISVTGSSGAITGATDGIYTRSSGGAITVQTLDSITGKGGDGVDANAGSGGITITDVTNIVGSQGRGVSAVTSNGGDISIQNVGVSIQNVGFGLNAVVEGKNGDGIYALTGGGINAGSINIGGDTAIGNVTGSVTGIRARTFGGGGAMTINTSSGDVSGATDGIYAVNGGAGALAIDANNVNGDNRYGIRAVKFNGDGKLSITTTGTVSGGASGIRATNSGAGDLVMNVAAVTSATGFGIDLANNVGGDVFLTATGPVTGGQIGTGGQQTGTGILAANSADTATRIAVVDVTGAANGIQVRTSNAGAKELTIESTGAVKGEYGDAIYAYQSGVGRVSISVVNATAADGDVIDVFAKPNNTGGVAVTATGHLYGYGRLGDGVRVANVGSGPTDINVASVTADVGSAIHVAHQGSDLTITAAGLISAAERGVFASNIGTGSTVVNVADVYVTRGDGLDVSNSDNGRATDLYVKSTGTITVVGTPSYTVSYTPPGGPTVYTTVPASSEDGIDVFNAGTGATTVIANKVTSAFGDGIRAVAGETATGDVTVTAAGDVTGYQGGIYALNNGAGDIVITAANATATGGEGHGVYANNSANGGALTIDTSAGAATGGHHGILAKNYGSGALSITASDVTATVGGEDAIDAYNSADGTSLTINTSSGTVSGIEYGIRAENRGAGATAVTTAGVTGGRDDGVWVEARGAGLVVDSRGGGVQGGENGIRASNAGDGATAITTAGVTGASGHGIFADNAENAAGLTIDSRAGAVSGGEDGIRAVNEGMGALSITTADATGGEGHGVYAYNYNAATDLTIDTSAGSVTGGESGIRAVNYGSGALSITAQNVAAGSADGDAIDVDNHGTDLTIETTGTVSSRDDGIDARNYGVNLFLSVAGGSVTGVEDGIDALNEGTGETVITIAGAVTGETEEGLHALTMNGANVTIDAGGSATGRLAAIVTDNAAAAGDPTDDTLTLNAGGSIDGDALLLAGADVFNDAGGSFTTVYGGDGLDTVNFTGGARTLAGSGTAGDSLQEFEIFNISSDGLVLAGTHVGLDEANFLAGANTLTGSLEATTASIAAGATLNAADGSQLVGMLTNDGTLNVGDSPGTFTVDGDLVLGATSVLPIEIGATSDLIVVTGDVTLGGTLDVIPLAGAPLGVSTRTIIDAGTGISGAFDAVNTEDGLLISQAVDVDAANFDLLLTTTLIPASFVDGLTDNQAAAGDNLITLLSNPALDQKLVDLAAAVGVIENVDILGSTLGELAPEGLDLGLKFLTASQSRFIDLAISQAATEGGAPAPAKLASLNGGPVAASPNSVATVWGAMEVFSLRQDGGADHIDFDGTAFSFAAGVSGIAAGPVSFGIAGGYSIFDGDMDGALGDAADASLAHIAGTASVRFGFSDLDARLDTVVGYAAGHNELVMNLIDPSTDAPVSQSGDASVSSVDWLTRLSIDGANNRKWALKPYVQAGASVYRQEAVNLGATEATALTVDELDNTRWQIGIGAAYERRFDDRLSISARAAGVHYFDDTENIFSSRFAAAPAGSASFRTTGREIDRQVQLDAALAYAHKSGFVISAGAFAEVGDLNLYGGNMKVQKRF